jgi:tryptophanyl-tRNA synthetase
MITPLSWLERVPTYKDKIDALEGNTLNTYGFLGYPLLQAADILIYRADFVPVGKDQLPHLELSRELCRRYNAFYGASFKEPEALLTQQSLLKGLDGRKMSKSYNNTLPVMADPHQISLLIKNMLTDPQRIRKTDPGNPDHCPVYEYHRLFSSSEKCHELDLQCRNAEIGCVACKAKCAENIINYLNPIQEKRKRLSLVEVKSQLDAAAKRARHRAKETLDIVKSQMGL